MHDAEDTPMAISPIQLFVASCVFTTALSGMTTPCESLASLSLKKTTIISVQSIDAGGFIVPASFQGKQAPSFKDLPAFCRVLASAKPTSDSDIRIEVWMPAIGWNGELRGHGNGLLGGGQGGNPTQLANGLRAGFAVAGNNGGHEGDASYALSHPEQVIDFGDRAAHAMTVTAKALMGAYYGKGPKFSYMDECGGGTVAALKEAQRYPTDYDGLAAGGFAAHLTHHTSSQMWIWQAAHKSEASYVPPAKFSLIHAAALEACDALDGVRDGVIEDPTRCKFDPVVLLCQGADRPDCLTAAQVETVRTIYAAPTNPRTKQEIYSPLYPGSELGWGTLTGPQPFSLPTDFFKYFAFKDPTWDYRTRPINFDSDIAAADRAENLVINAIDPNISKFVARGGKLILYEGWNDPVVAPRAAVDYYKSVADNLGERKTGDAVRLYMAPGVMHCGGGEGPNNFNMLAVLQGWVERKKAPQEVIATRMDEGRVVRSRPLCPYPQTAVYKGSGSTDDASNFSCKVR